MFTTRMTTRPLTSTLDRFGALDRVLDQMIPDRAALAASVWVPPLEVAERADAYLIAVELPGVREEELELNFESNVLTVRGRKLPTFAAEPDAEAMRLHVSERQAGAFERSVRLPEYVEGDRIEARFVDGVLQVTVPKSPAAQPRRIALKRETAHQQAPQQITDPAPESRRS